MSQAQELRKVMGMWSKMRTKLGMKGKKYGQPRNQYMITFFEEELDEVEIFTAMENFLTDEWWSNDGKAYQDLEHFIKNYPKFLSDRYKKQEKNIFSVERE